MTCLRPTCKSRLIQVGPAEEEILGIVLTNPATGQDTIEVVSICGIPTGSNTDCETLTRTMRYTVKLQGVGRENLDPTDVMQMLQDYPYDANGDLTTEWYDLEATGCYVRIPRECDAYDYRGYTIGDHTVAKTIKCNGWTKKGGALKPVTFTVDVSYNNLLLNNSEILYQYDKGTNSVTQVTDINDLPSALCKFKWSSATTREGVEQAFFLGLRDEQNNLVTPDTATCPDPDADCACCPPLDMVCKDDNGDPAPTPPINSAGVPFTPVLTRDVTNTTFTITKPVPWVNGCKFEKSRNTINCDQIWFYEIQPKEHVSTGGNDLPNLLSCVKYDPGTVRITGVATKPGTFCCEPIMMVTISFKVRNIEHGDDNDGWNDWVQNKGKKELVCDCSNGTSTLKSPDGGYGEALWLDKNGKFFVLPSAKDQGCDGNPDPERHLFVGYQKYNAINMHTFLAGGAGQEEICASQSDAFKNSFGNGPVLCVCTGEPAFVDTCFCDAASDEEQFYHEDLFEDLFD